MLGCLLLGACAICAGTLWAMSRESTSDARRVLMDGKASPGRRKAAAARLKADAMETVTALELAAKTGDPELRDLARASLAAIQGR